MESNLVREHLLTGIDYREITLFLPKNSNMLGIVGTNTVNIPYAGG
ncbi:MAG: hypothetical protein WBP64_17505 [Nitrososphaeraceae archaeon]